MGRPKTSLFFSCFGYSKNVSLDKPLEQAHLSSSAKRKRCFSWPRFRIKPSAIKTVPLLQQAQYSSEKTTTDQYCKYKKFIKSKSKLKPDDKSNQLSINHQTPATHSPQLTQDLPLPQQDGHRDTNLGNAEKLDGTDAKIDDTCPFKCLPSSRTNDNVRTALSRTSLRPVSNTVSSPVPGRHGGNQSSLHSHHVTLRKSQKGLSKSRKMKDPGVGISIIIMAIMITVLLCGRLYAILCTSAWFYFLPRLRIKEDTVAAKEEVNSGELNNSTQHLDMDSKDYKKKVILEGLLERNPRTLHNTYHEKIKDSSR